MGSTNSSTEAKRGDYYFLNLTPTVGPELMVTRGGREVCDESYRSAARSHQVFVLEFVASGEGTLTWSGKTTSLGPGSVFCSLPGDAYQLQVAVGSVMVKYFVEFVGSEAPAQVARAFPDQTAWVISSTVWVQRLFEDLKATADSLRESRFLVSSLILKQLLAMLTDGFLSSPHQDAALTQKFRRLRVTLRELALRNVDLPEAAKSCGVSPSYLRRLFRRFDTITPHQYMIRCRMALAASLLLDPQLLVKEVATLVGYEDQYHFSRTFKGIYGQSPDGFRTQKK